MELNAQRFVVSRYPRFCNAGPTMLSNSGLRPSPAYQTDNKLIVDGNGGHMQDLSRGLKALFDPEVFLAKQDRGRTIVEYRKNQSVFSQGEPASSIFYIRDGKIKLTVVSEGGKEAVIAILGPDEFFGLRCLTGQPRRIATAEAMTGCKVMHLDKKITIAALNQEPAFSKMLLAHVLARSNRVEEDLIDQLFNSSEKRLARALLLLANFGKEGKPQRIVAKISQETLAEMVGTTRARVSYFMNKFRQSGFIDYRGKRLEVHSSLLGVVLGDQPRSVTERV
jgi:CRP/FNR family transcriptional regulator, cyclic AMP receptor protein